ncbi:hypothetical protein RPALISO_105 [Ruegeria phage RpAliso]|nr:hypothetical protein RPALISO_105 [Ruegeria phage RpAliso]
MARATYIHAIISEDPTDFPIIAVATVKHELVRALSQIVSRGVDLSKTSWSYVRAIDAGAGGFNFSAGFFENPTMEDTVPVEVFWAKETQS